MASCKKLIHKKQTSFGLSADCKDLRCLLSAPWGTYQHNSTSLRFLRFLIMFCDLFSDHRVSVQIDGFLGEVWASQSPVGTVRLPLLLGMALISYPKVHRSPILKLVRSSWLKRRRPCFKLERVVSGAERSLKSLTPSYDLIGRITGC